MNTISYRPLLIQLAEKGISTTKLGRETNISHTTIAKIKRGELVSMRVIINICTYLDCKIENVIEIIPKKTTDTPDNTTIKMAAFGGIKEITQEQAKELSSGLNKTLIQAYRIDNLI